jgi:hypothetical protein
MPVAYGWKGLSSNVSAVDLAGWQGWLWARWQCLPNRPSASKHRIPDMYLLNALQCMLGLNLDSMFCISTWTSTGIFKESADLKQNFFHLVTRYIFQKRNDTCKAERPHLQRVHGFLFMCNAVPSLTWRHSFKCQTSAWVCPSRD